MNGLAMSPPPPRASVDVWLVPVGGAGHAAAGAGAESDARCGLLDDGERALLDRLRMANDRWGYVVAHLLVRLALSRATRGEVPPARWRFDRSAHGRPSVAASSGLPRLDFSLSRSSKLAVVAVANTRDCRVGVDAERSDRPLCCVPADVALSPAERSRLARYPADLQPAEFLKLWTLKEAYGKLCGRGICLPLERVEVAASPARLVRTEDGLEPPGNVHLETRHVRTTNGVYRTSLAVQGAAGVRPRATFHLLDTLWPDAGDVPRLPTHESGSGRLTDGSRPRDRRTARCQ